MWQQAQFSSQKFNFLGFRTVWTWIASESSPKDHYRFRIWVRILSYLFVFPLRRTNNRIRYQPLSTPTYMFYSISKINTHTHISYSISTLIDTYPYIVYDINPYRYLHTYTIHMHRILPTNVLYDINPYRYLHTYIVVSINYTHILFDINSYWYLNTNRVCTKPTLNDNYTVLSYSILKIYRYLYTYIV